MLIVLKALIFFTSEPYFAIPLEESKPNSLSRTHNTIEIELKNRFTKKNGKVVSYDVIVGKSNVKAGRLLPDIYIINSSH